LPANAGPAAADAGSGTGLPPTVRDMSMNRTRPQLAVLWLLLLFIPQAALLYFFRVFTVDDTWIFLRYAQNLAAGHGLVFNPGEAVEGYTSFLWAILLAGGIKAGADGLLVARVLGVALALATTVVGYLLGRRVTPNGGYLTLLAPAGLATSVPLGVWAMSGMGTVLFTFFVTLTLYLHLQSTTPLCVPPHAGGYSPPCVPPLAGGYNPSCVPPLAGGYRGVRTGRSHPFLAAAGWVCGLAALSRPEGWLFLVIILGHRLWRPTRHGRWADAVAYLGPFLALTVPHLLWRHSYYGDWVPNTFYIKAILTKEAGVLYTWNFLQFHGGLVFLALCALPLALRRRSEEWTAVAMVVLLWTVYVARMGDWMPLFRFFIPILPLCFVLLQTGVVELAQALSNVAVSRTGLRLLVGLLLLAASGALICQVHANRDLRGMSPNQLYARVGRELRQYAQPGDTLAAIDAGAVPYFSELPTTDIIGLTDAHIAHTPYQYYEFDRPIFGHEYAAWLRYDGAYILGKKPTFIELPTGGKVLAGGEVISTRGEVYLLMDEPEFQANYVPLFERGHLTIFIRKDQVKQHQLR